MTDAPVQQEILFLDNFTHQNSNIVHWDHIKFDHVVYLEQIRIIPRYCTITLRNGNKYNGQTTPKKFKLEFYANNLNKNEDGATLEKIGGIQYDDDDNKEEGNFLLEPSSLPMDWLVIVGSYTSLSIAVIGVKAKPRSSLESSAALAQLEHTPNQLPYMGANNHPPPVHPHHVHLHPPQLHYNHLPVVGQPMNQFGRPAQQALLPTPNHPPINTSNSAPNLANLIGTQQRPSHHRYPPIQQSRTAPNPIRHHPYVFKTNSLKDEPTPTQQPTQELKTLQESQQSISDPTPPRLDTSLPTPENVPDMTCEFNLVKCYIELDEVGEENRLVEELLVNKPGETPDQVNNFLDEQLDVFELFKQFEQSPSTLVTNPILNHYELYKAGCGADWSPTNHESNLIEEYAVKLDDTNKKLLSSKGVDELDALLVLLKRTDRFSLRLFDRLLAPRVDELVKYLVGNLGKETRNRRKLNLTLKYVNVLLVKFDKVTAGKLIKANVQLKLVHLLHVYTVESVRLKLLACIYNSLYTKYGCHHFTHTDAYSKFVNTFHGCQLDARMSVAVTAILDKVSFYQSLRQLCARCESKFRIADETNNRLCTSPTKTDTESQVVENNNINNNDDDQAEFFSTINKQLDVIYHYIKTNMKCNAAVSSTDADYRCELDNPSDDEADSESSPTCTYVNYDDDLFNRTPMRALFQPLCRLKSDKLPPYSYFLYYVDKFSFVKNLLLLWSYANSHSAHTVTDQVEQTFRSFLLPSELNQLSHAGLEYLLTNNTRLTRCVLTIMPAVNLARSLKSIISLHLLKCLHDRVSTRLGTSLVSTNPDQVLAEACNLTQSLYVHVLSDQRPIFVHPDGNMSNKYTEVLLDWLDYLIEQPDERPTRLYFLNSLVGLFHHIVVSNDQWDLHKPLKSVLKLNRSVNRLLNCLIVTKLRPSLTANKSYFVLIERLKSIRAHLEPMSRCTNDQLDVLTACVDSLRLNVDANLNLFFRKASLKLQPFRINFLNGCITQLRFVKRLITHEAQEDNESAHFGKCVYLGHLISKNFGPILLHSLGRLNDYLTFYFYVKLDTPPSLLVLEQLVNFIEPCLYCLKTIMAKTGPIERHAHMLDALFRFYGLFNYIFQKPAQKRVTNVKRLRTTLREFQTHRSSGNQLRWTMDQIDAHLKEMFAMFRHCGRFYEQLAVYTLEMPFNLTHGLTIMARMGGVDLMYDGPNMAQLFRFAYLVSDQTSEFRTFKSICLSLIESGREANLVKIYLELAWNQLDSLKQCVNLLDLNGAQFKLDMTSADQSKLNSDLSSAEESIYDTKLEEQSDKEIVGILAKVETTSDAKPGTNLSEAIVNNRDVDAFDLDDRVFKFGKLIRFLCLLVHNGARLTDDDQVKLVLNCADYAFAKPDNYRYILIELIKYFNQIDLNNKSTPTNPGTNQDRVHSAIQTTILELVQCLLRKSCRLFLDESESDCSLYKFLLKAFTDHLNTPPLPAVTNGVLTCLVLMFKLNVIRPVDLKLMLANFDLLRYVNDLATVEPSDISQWLDLLNKFYLVLNYTIDSLHSVHKLTPFRENILKWSSRITNEMLIDSISTSSDASGSQHALINLDRRLESLSTRDDKHTWHKSDDKQKHKLAVNLSKWVIRHLNEDQVGQATSGSAHVDCEAAYRLTESTEPGQTASDQVEIDSGDFLIHAHVLLADTTLFRKLCDYSEEPPAAQKQLSVEGELEDGDGEGRLKKAASSEFINTRTGIKYKAPMRGGHVNQASRGPAGPNASQPVNTNGPGSNPRTDPFRTRPPNTSRPPSLHVDDYLRMENNNAMQKQQQQMGQMAEGQQAEGHLTKSNSFNEFTSGHNSNLITIQSDGFAKQAVQSQQSPLTPVYNQQPQQQQQQQQQPQQQTMYQGSQFGQVNSNLVIVNSNSSSYQNENESIGLSNGLGNELMQTNQYNNGNINQTGNNIVLTQVNRSPTPVKNPNMVPFQPQTPNLIVPPNIMKMPNNHPNMIPNQDLRFNNSQNHMFATQQGLANSQNGFYSDSVSNDMNERLLMSPPNDSLLMSPPMQASNNLVGHQMINHQISPTATMQQQYAPQLQLNAQQQVQQTNNPHHQFNVQAINPSNQMFPNHNIRFNPNQMRPMPNNQGYRPNNARRMPGPNSNPNNPNQGPNSTYNIRSQYQQRQ